MRTTLVDLVNETFSEDTPSPEVVRRFLGGRGLNMYFLDKYLDTDVDPLSPENPLIFGTGLLTGTRAPNSSRMNITAKSPESYVLGDSNVGGQFPAWMRMAGFDRLILTGKAEKLSYIFLKDGKIEVRDATKYKGMNNNECRAAITEDLGKVEVACIGEAGENQVRFASIMTGVKNAAGRTGMGAVMGSKNIKAIVVAKSKRPKASQEFIDFAKGLYRRIADSGVARALSTIGTPFLYRLSNKLGAIRTRNSQETRFKHTLDGEHFLPYSDKSVGCYNCAVRCRHQNTLGGEGPEYSTVGLLGANLGIGDPEDVIRLNNVANDLGLDTSSAGSIMGWAMELYEKGLIASDTELEFGNPKIAEELLYKISKREGVGDLLAESTRLIERLGDDAEEARKYLIEVNGLSQSCPHDSRVVKSFALGLVVSSRGADHLRNRPTLDLFPDGLKVKVYGEEHATDFRSYDSAAEKVVLHENIYAVVDSLGICKFVCKNFNSPSMVGYTEFSDMIRFSTGMEMTEEELVQVGERVVDLERRINMKMGIEDKLPWRYMQPNSDGESICPDRFGAALQSYYQLRGWNTAGQPQGPLM